MAQPVPMLDSAALRKARGAFFTPDAMARHVVGWAVRCSSDSVLEPSCGEAAFLLAAGERLLGLGGPGKAVGAQLHGIEIHELSARKAERNLRSAGLRATVTVADFFGLGAVPEPDVVVGNPPFVRYQHFVGGERVAALAAARADDVRLTALASSWAAFTVHAARFLRRGGRLGLVLPAELLTVNYAAGVRRFLLETFRNVELVLFTERVFPGVLEEVVLLLADGFGEGPATGCVVRQARNVSDLGSASRHRWTPPGGGGKWTGCLVPSRVRQVTDGLSCSGAVVDLREWGETTLGAVTGNNGFFALPADALAALGIPAADLLALSPPGSRHLRQLTFTTSTWSELHATGSRT